MDEDRTIKWWVIGVIVLALAAGGYWWWQGRIPQPPPQAAAPPVIQAPPVPDMKGEPAPIQHPIEQAPAVAEQPAEPKPAPLPALVDSDATLTEALAGLIGEKSLREFFIPENLASRIVATIDNLPREKVAVKIRPVRGPAGLMAVDGSGAERTIGAANESRYAPYVRLVDAVPTKPLASLYLRFYPLLQQAYRELGYPNAHFNDRLVAVIDHLLATPDIQGPIKLVQPKVLYEFADPALESRSAGQKVLLRMGAKSAAQVKIKLREFRREITTKPPPQS